MSEQQQYQPPAPIVTDPQALGPSSTDAFSPFSPPISPVNTPRDLLPKGPLPYGKYIHKIHLHTRYREQE